jgi:hypothetical protein
MASSNVSPTSDISPNSFADRNVPQWKKELIQRRKNLAKTISAANVTLSPPLAGKLIGSPTKLVKGECCAFYDFFYAWASILAIYRGKSVIFLTLHNNIMFFFMFCLLWLQIFL